LRRLAATVWTLVRATASEEVRVPTNVRTGVRRGLRRFKTAVISASTRVRTPARRLATKVSTTLTIETTMSKSWFNRASTMARTSEVTAMTAVRASATMAPTAVVKEPTMASRSVVISVTSPVWEIRETLAVLTTVEMAETSSDTENLSVETVVKVLLTTKVSRTARAPALAVGAARAEAPKPSRVTIDKNCMLLVVVGVID